MLLFSPAYFSLDFERPLCSPEESDATGTCDVLSKTSTHVSYLKASTPSVDMCFSLYVADLRAYTETMVCQDLFGLRNLYFGNGI